MSDNTAQINADDLAAERLRQDREEILRTSGKRAFYSACDAIGVKDQDGLLHALGGIQRLCSVHPDGYIVIVSNGKWVPLSEGLPTHPVVVSWMRRQGAEGNIPLEAKELQVEKLEQELDDATRAGYQNWAISKRGKLIRQIRQLKQEIHDEKMARANPEKLPGFAPQHLLDEQREIETELAILKKEVHSGKLNKDQRDQAISTHVRLNAKRQQLLRRIQEAIDAGQS